MASSVEALAAGQPVTAKLGVERPKQPEHGDFATNAALAAAKGLGEQPREFAEKLTEELGRRLGPALVSAEVAGPGFVNLVLSDDWYSSAVDAVLAAGDAWGSAVADPPLQINVEFVSANPTGPVHVGGTRNAVYGDALGRLLSFVGHKVHREYYVNDAGSQISALGASVQARARGEEPPDGGYQGEYIIALAGDIEGAADLPADEVSRLAVELMVADAERSLARLRVVFDDWFHETTLHAGSPTPVEKALAILDGDGRSYRSDDALWLRTTEFDDDKDRVLERSNGEHTYFASDIAYHQDKIDRGFDLMIDVWGADHHGYIKRMEASIAALGHDPACLELLIMQLVHLVDSGERAQMSKRAGDFVTLDELIDDIGVDAARWFLLERSHETTMELDLTLAREQSAENPVYYVQYAHARIASILARGAEEPSPAEGEDEPLHASERELVRRLLEFPSEVADAAERRSPHRIADYSHKTAQAFSAFYRDCPVIDAPPAQRDFRLRLCAATGQVLARSLDLLGVSAPQSMTRD
ncbi:MAG: arginine--tRNA ligase [Actinobacteria bacterium]|nr:arginine--tRNA ligase [Actinomycetota bacterium]